VNETVTAAVEGPVGAPDVSADETRTRFRPVGDGWLGPADTMSDPGGERRLLRDARRGDHGAFVFLMRRHEARLRALAFRVLRDPDLVADAVQETALRAFRSLDTFRDDAAVSSWLYRVTYNVCLDLLARSRRQTEVAQRFRWEPEGYAPDPARRVSAGDELSRALDGLSPEHRAVVYLCIQQDLDHTTVAEVLGIPYGTVGSRLNHARAVLQRALSREDDR
jgi:RNA polymerase sigma-70 factor, ECF subfamily